MIVRVQTEFNFMDRDNILLEEIVNFHNICHSCDLSLSFYQ